MKTIKIIAMIMLLAAISGCVDKSIGIYKLGAKSDLSIFGDAVVDGCIVKVEGDPVGLSLWYRDEKCEIQYGVAPIGE